MINEGYFVTAEIPLAAKVQVLTVEIDSLYWVAKKHENPEVAAAANLRLKSLQDLVAEMQRAEEEAA